MILLDTHVLLWWQNGGDRLSKRARDAITSTEVLVSPISMWEIAMLLDKGRIAVDRDPVVWSHDLLQSDGVGLAPLSATAALAAGFLPAVGFEGDPADAMLYATARELDIPLVTKDRNIRNHARLQRDLRVIW